MIISVGLDQAGIAISAGNLR